jgi:hypothetical protein
MPDITFDDIDAHLVSTVALRQRGVFDTLAVARDPEMLRRHPNHDGAYNGLVPPASGQPRLVLVNAGSPARWRVATAHATEPASSPAASGLAEAPAPASPVELGPQHPGEPRFTARMRRHQSWYRSTVLGLAHGVGPQRGGRPLGNCLTAEDGEGGANFLSPDIFGVAQQRLDEPGGTVERYRLLHNMLSSQPMCFNLFGPLALDLELATRLIAVVLPGRVAAVLDVKLEWAPEPAADHLGDRTAFDALVIYRQPDGQRAFLGIETKLTEPFSQNVHDGPLYRRWMDERAPWRPEAFGSVANLEHNQLWRDHLLAVAVQRQPGWAEGRLALVRHPLDHDCARVTAGYRRLLREGDDSLIDLPLDQLVQRWAPVLRSEAERQWLTAFDLRYLDLGASGS